MKRYGVRNASQYHPVFDKIAKSKNTKLYEFLQGWEPYAIDYLLGEFCEDDLYFGKDVPRIEYIYTDNKYHIYSPDIYIKSIDTIVEVKSVYTYNINLDQNYAKFKNTLEKYNLKVMIYDEKLELKSFNFIKGEKIISKR